MDVSRETPDVTAKPKCYDLTDMLVRVSAGPRCEEDAQIHVSRGLGVKDMYVFIRLI